MPREAAVKDEDIAYIKEQVDKGRSQKALATEFHCSQAAISRALLKDAARIQKEAHGMADPTVLDADTPAEVRYGAVHEFDTPPDGYAKTIQPMQPYSDAEEWALNKSMELYGFLGAIVRDQYGRILDGNQRQRVARLRGLGVPHTITHVRDDAHAIEIARTLNTIRRHYTKEQREELAPMMRDQGFSYRAIAEALGVGKSTVYRDVFGELQIRDESESADAPVPNGTPEVVITAEVETNLTPEPIITDAPVPNGTPEPAKRVKGRDQKSYPSQRPAATKPTTSPADRQLAQVINLLMSHAQQWSDQHWQAFLEVVQNLRGSKASAPATE